MMKNLLFICMLTLTFTSNGQVNFSENTIFNPTGLFLRGASGIGVSNIENSNFQTTALTTFTTLNLDYYFNNNWNISLGLQGTKMSFNNIERDFTKIKSGGVYSGVNWNYSLLSKTKIYLGAGGLYSIIYDLNINPSNNDSEIELKETIGSNTLIVIEAGVKYEFLNPYILHLSFSSNYGLSSNHKREDFEFDVIKQLLVQLGISFKL